MIMSIIDTSSVEEHPLAQLSKILSLSRTTRGTLRQRAPKGLIASIKYDVLANEPPEMNEKSLQQKLKRMAPDNRQRVEAVLEQLTADDRREYVLKLLAGYKMY